MRGIAYSSGRPYVRGAIFIGLPDMPLETQSRTKHKTSIRLNRCELLQTRFRRVREIARSDWLRHVCPSACNNSAPTGRIFMKFDIWIFFENLPRNFKFNYNLTRITVTLYEDRYTFLIISRSVLLRRKNFSDKSWKGNSKHSFYALESFWKIVHLWDNVEKYCTSGQVAHENMAHAQCMLDA